MRHKKRFWFAVLAVVLGLAVLEGMLGFVWLGLEYAARRQQLPRAVEFKEDFHAQHDRDLGWVHIPGKQIANFYGPEQTITINRQGLRGKEEYEDDAPEDRMRVICLGDSFTLGYGVDDSETYPAQLETLNPRIQTLNMGQGGYSVGQCYLWYERDGGQLYGDVLVVALILDDVWRMTGGRMANGAAMPSFELVEGMLQVGGQPVPEKIATGEPIDNRGGWLGFLFERSAIFRTVGLVVAPARKAREQTNLHEQLQVALAILDEIKKLAEARGTTMVLMIVPEQVELTDTARQELYREATDVIGLHAQQAGIPVLELSSDFLATRNLRRLYLDEQWHHLSAAGNRLVAEKLNTFLLETIEGYPTP